MLPSIADTEEESRQTSVYPKNEMFDIQENVKSELSEFKLQNTVSEHYQYNELNTQTEHEIEKEKLE